MEMSFVHVLLLMFLLQLPALPDQFVRYVPVTRMFTFLLFVKFFAENPSQDAGKCAAPVAAAAGTFVPGPG